MHTMLLMLFAFAATSMGISLPQRGLERRDSMLNTNTGCVSYVDPSERLDNENTVLQWYSDQTMALSLSDWTSCLNEYGCGNFSDSWNGNVCGGRGWFKGPPSSKTSATDCFQQLAPWVLMQGIRGGSTYYKAQLGRSGCYMGYNDPGSDSSS